MTTVSFRLNKCLKTSTLEEHRGRRKALTVAAAENALQEVEAEQDELRGKISFEVILAIAMPEIE